MHPAQSESVHNGSVGDTGGAVSNSGSSRVQLTLLISMPSSALKLSLVETIQFQACASLTSAHISYVITLQGAKRLRISVSVYQKPRSAHTVGCLHRKIFWSALVGYISFFSHLLQLLENILVNNDTKAVAPK